jgi:mannosyltransferase
MKILNWIKENYLFSLLIVISFVFRIYKLDFQSPWGDELFTLINSSSNKSVGEIYEILKTDVHPPFYYYIIHFFFIIFGDTSFVARFVSVLFGTAGIVAVYYLTKELFNRKAISLIAVGLLIINYFHIYYSQEARMYSMLFLTTTLSFLYLVKFIKKPSYKNSIIHAVFSLLMIYTHFFAIFTLFSEYLIILYFIIKPYKTTNLNFFKYSFISGIITVIFYIPSIVIF